MDDDNSKLNMNIDGVKVFGINKNFEKFIKKNNVDKLFITTKKISSSRLKYLYNYFQNMIFKFWKFHLLMNGLMVFLDYQISKKLKFKIY